MADDFSFLTDSDDEKAVQDLISQAMDHSVLEQIAAINCSSFSNSDNLPSHLENRFRKLKSLPTTTAAVATGSRFPPAKSKSFTPSSGHDSNSNEHRPPFSTDKSSPDEHSDENRDPAESKQKPKSEFSNRNGLKSESELKSGSGLSKSPSDPWSLSSPESEPKACDRRSQKQHSDENRGFSKSAKSKLKLKSYKPRLIESESDSGSGSLSPPRRSIGCLWCSPKKEKSVGRKQGKENRLISKSLSSKDWGSEYDDEFLKTFSIKEQNKMMKQAMKEEEKINKEAEKIVKWAKQASDRMMNVSGLSLHDEDHEFSE
ncbi:uncharacterized protein [Rutidosis leptorrhynchoides]|uniref:uncharacterized protein n=1 Tax=Rutidosis leptorrhynchoides TaxID=125765 RepID=UPI003A99ACB3